MLPMLCMSFVYYFICSPYFWYYIPIFYNIINELNTSDNGVSYDVARTKQLIEDKKEFWKKMLLNKYKENEVPKYNKNKKK